METVDPATPIAWRRSLIWLRWGLLGTLLIALVGYFTLPAWVDSFAGSSDWSVLDKQALSAEADALVEVQLRSLEGKTLLDVHAHLAGRGSGSDCWVHPDMESRWHPFSWVRFQAYLSAGNVDSEDSDEVFAKNLFSLANAMPIPVRMHLLGFDYAYDAAGVQDLDGSAFSVPDDYVYAQAKEAGERFVPAPSIHPLEPGALGRLGRAARSGAKLIKWLPAAQNIDPSNPALDPFYAAVIENDLALLVHCGSENAVETGHSHGLGNPLRLRHPLGMGVRIVVAHCATTGEGKDLDNPSSPDQPNHKLFLRLMDEEQYVGLLFGDISTLTQVNHFKEGLLDILARTDLHPRLLNGSDWPLPAIDILYQLGPLAEVGLIRPEDRQALKEIFEHNPLLFDLALKRSLRHPDTGVRFDDAVFVVSPDRPF